MVWCTSSTPSEYPELESLRPAAEGPEMRRGEGEKWTEGGKQERVERVGGRKGRGCKEGEERVERSGKRV